MRKLAFTLIELLAVIVILAVLAAILFPVYNRRPYPATRSACQSNLKQISLGFKQYVQDYDWYFPRFNIQNVGSTSSETQTVNYWAQAVFPYIKSLQVFQCPAEKNKLGTDYYYSRVVSGHSEKPFKYSASTVLLTEGPDTADCSLATASAAVTSGSPPAYAIHLDGSNYAFVDGHVKWLQSTRTPKNLPAAQGGFTFQS